MTDEVLKATETAPDSGVYVLTSQDATTTTIVSASSWATIATVKGITGKDVDQDAINLARDVIELKSGAIEAAAEVGPRDRYWLGKAVAYQAAWLASQVDYLERLSVTSASQDGQSANYTADGLELAPLARLALKRLSWRGTRTVQPGAAPAGVKLTPLISDDHGGWQPL
jgi:hypothetical protein